jgi:hypothetical protein
MVRCLKLAYRTLKRLLGTIVGQLANKLSANEPSLFLKIPAPRLWAMTSENPEFQHPAKPRGPGKLRFPGCSAAPEPGALRAVLPRPQPSHPERPGVTTQESGRRPSSARHAAGRARSLSGLVVWRAGSVRYGISAAVWWGGGLSRYVRACAVRGRAVVGAAPGSWVPVGSWTAAARVLRAEAAVKWGVRRTAAPGRGGEAGRGL